jgi:hypothetical protein
MSSESCSTPSPRDHSSWRSPTSPPPPPAWCCPSRRCSRPSSAWSCSASTPADPGSEWWPWLAGAFLYFTGSLGATAIGMAAALICLGSNTAASVLGRVSTVVRLRSAGGHRGLDVGRRCAPARRRCCGRGHLAAVVDAWLIIAWLAVVNTAWAFVLWNRSLVHLPAATSAVINNLMLVEIAVLAWMFLDERRRWVRSSAIAVVTVGVVAGSGTSRAGGSGQSSSVRWAQPTSPPPRGRPSSARHG